MPDSLVVERDVYPSRSQSFILRMWLEDLGEDNAEWRGKVQCIASGEARYFREWHTLITYLEEMLAPADTRVPQSPTPSDSVEYHPTSHTEGST